MGNDGLMPALHVGGVQDAATSAPPTADAVAVKVLPKTLLVVPVPEGIET